MGRLYRFARGKLKTPDMDVLYEDTLRFSKHEINKDVANQIGSVLFGGVTDLLTLPSSRRFSPRLNESLDRMSRRMLDDMFQTHPSYDQTVMERQDIRARVWDMNSLFERRAVVSPQIARVNGTMLSFYAEIAGNYDSTREVGQLHTGGITIADTIEQSLAEARDLVPLPSPYRI